MVQGMKEIQDFQKTGNRKIAVYTVIAGDYDYLKDPEYVMENCDYICFTDQAELKSDIWQIRRMDSDARNSDARLSRRYKILAHEYLSEYEWSIYVDGNVRIIGNLWEYVCSESKGAPLLCLKHPYRNNVYEEAEECISLHKEDPQIIRKQMERYRAEGYMGENGLITANILVRNHMHEDVIRLMELWWKELKQGAGRDQLSFNYACWKLGMEYDVSELKCWKSPYWLNPGIHTSEIRKAEEELIEHIQLEAYMDYQISEREKLIAQKEQELEDVATQLKRREQELTNVNMQLDHTNQVINILMEDRDGLERQLNEMLSSRSWKYTGWLRKIHTYLQKIGKQE